MNTYKYFTWTSVYMPEDKKRCRTYTLCAGVPDEFPLSRQFPWFFTKRVGDFNIFFQQRARHAVLREVHAFGGTNIASSPAICPLKKGNTRALTTTPHLALDSSTLQDECTADFKKVDELFVHCELAYLLETQIIHYKWTKIHKPCVIISTYNLH